MIKWEAMHQTQQEPPTLLGLQSPQKVVFGRRNWVQRPGPPHRPPLGGESLPESPFMPGDDLPIGKLLSPCSWPSSLGSQAGEGEQLGWHEVVERGLVLGIISESDNEKIDDNSPSTTTSWHTLWSCMH